MRITFPIVIFIAAAIIILPLVLGAVNIHENPKSFIILSAIGGALVVIGWVSVIAKSQTSVKE